MCPQQFFLVLPGLKFNSDPIHHCDITFTCLECNSSNYFWYWCFTNWWCIFGKSGSYLPVMLWSYKSTWCHIFYKFYHLITGKISTGGKSHIPIKSYLGKPHTSISVGFLKVYLVAQLARTTELGGSQEGRPFSPQMQFLTLFLEHRFTKSCKVDDQIAGNSISKVPVFKICWGQSTQIPLGKSHVRLSTLPPPPI